MNVRDLSNWEQFDEEIKCLLVDWQQKPGLSRLLFRGQSNSDWQLKTTLERYAPDSLRARKYYQVIHEAKYQIESLTDRSWNIPTPKEYNRWLRNQDFIRGFGNLNDAYAYIIHLRHHEFPSPLLDWSQSPYVAAFFAFNNATISDKVSIYAHIERVRKGPSGSSNAPRIHGLGPTVRSHTRHVLQQCEYTICFERSDNQWGYAFHEDVFKGDSEQDVLWKFNIPSTERLKVLRVLDRFNLNAFSLFGSEESLMETVALRFFHLNRR
jgi:FRG domain-containing protein